LAFLSKAKFGLSAGNLPFGIHYSWIIISILATVQVFASSISMAAGIMVPPLNDAEGDFGWSLGTIGLVIASYYLFGAMYAPITGWLGDRYGSRRMLLAAATMYIVSMFLLSQVTAIWHFFVFFGILLSLTQSLAMVPLMAAVSGWFRRRLGVGVGLLWGAGGAGTAVMAPVIGGFIEAMGWQSTFMLIGAIGGGTMLCLVPFMRNKPADIGIQPYGARPADAPMIVRDKTVDRLRQKVFNQHTRKTKPFWNLPLIHALGCAGHGTVLIYVIPMAIDRGAFSSLAQAGIILTIIALISVISRIVTPIMAEAYGTRKMMAASLSIQAITVFMLFWSHDAWSFYLFAAIFGIGFGGEWTGYLVINRQYYGEGPMGTVYGWQTTGALMGHAVATGLAGLVVYVTGSFNVVMAISVGFSSLGVVVIGMLDDTSHVLIPNWEDDVPQLEAQTNPNLETATADD
jgi:MFS family permease|tara:strand:+ start:66 stop:1439 length:1374 start_codon:yes stop_codon:yes gene_type:complete